MTDSEKLIIVFYLDITGLDHIDVPMYVSEVSSRISFDETVRPFFIPIKNSGHTKVDVINPKNISKREYNKIIKRFYETMDEIKKKFEKKPNTFEIEEKKNYFLINGVKMHWGFKLLPKGFEAITLFGHVFDVREKEDLRKYLSTQGGKVTVNHEHIHMLQGKSFKLGYFTFYVLYLWYWFIGLFKYGTKNNASYYHIPFEVEAYTNEQDFNYDKTEWRKYIK